jgi:hypothetical protein
VTAKAGCDDDDRADVISSKAIPDLECGVESDGLGFSDQNNVPPADLRRACHDFGNAERHGINNA